ncbi:Polysaccharide lyase family 8 protein [Mycena chlorophos]|uniref:Polysaccharide lyase family 8 protein n=1 Tax=Mycena chlorophos TaxID=658473 RepID=A0A8H6WG15_MYCCL|nr:Polysaccharide lyase family 8 protein [Mycena chlorophos]
MKAHTLFSQLISLSALFVHGSLIQRSLSSSQASLLPSSPTSSIPTLSSTTSSSSAGTVSASATAAPTSASASATISASASASSPLTTAPFSTTSLDPATATDIATLLERRLSNIVGELLNATEIDSWLTTQEANGQWPDVDYTTGCTAQQANWPAELHLSRLSTLAGAWHGDLPGAEQYSQDADVLNAAKLAMDWWFDNDMTNDACLDQGGKAACPCGTPGLWNINWFPGFIGVPEVVSISCLLLNSTLDDAEIDKCINITARAYNAFYVPIPQVSVITGANLLDIAKIGIDLGLFTTNASLISDAYSRIHAELEIKTPNRADGIRPDGSFGQHTGVLYNGNYGKDYTNDAVDLEVEAGGTMFQANSTSKSAMATLFNGDHWMIYKNILTGVLHWDFSALGRFIAFPTTDVTQATASILLNLTKIEALGQEWESDALVDFATSLSENVTSANAGALVGNKMFFDNDYMVQRGSGYVSTLKMFSTRSVNTECLNLANPFGFHLSTGVLHTYIHGNEYEDIAASQDWSMIAGITTDYQATPLNCAQTSFVGIESFVGGVSNGEVGVAAFRYTNPLTKAFQFQKTYFFMNNDVQFVMISNITSLTNASVISVLDQKRHNGDVVIGGSVVTEQNTSTSGAHAPTLWHDNVGYSFAASPAGAFSLATEVGEKFGNWTLIGTSPSPPTTVDLFSAWIVHEAVNTSLAYAMYPAVDRATFTKKVKQNPPKVVQNDKFISAVMDTSNSMTMTVFWSPSGGSVNYAPGSPAAFTIASNGTAAILLDPTTRNITVADPTQTLSAVEISLSIAVEHLPGCSAGISKTMVITLPTTNGLGGSSVSTSF